MAIGKDWEGLEPPYWLLLKHEWEEKAKQLLRTTTTSLLYLLAMGSGNWEVAIETKKWGIVEAYSQTREGSYVSGEDSGVSRWN